ncbi:MAG: lasso peptide biosynthesis B2 protein [Deltaproteobacteria bacterium]|nr:lasso peptide biosynthesis B2 protein [Deltaproteobacteria bacterium]
MRLALRRRARHARVLARALPGLFRSPEHRRLFVELLALSQSLPRRLDRPLPEAMSSLAPQATAGASLPEGTTRDLADLAALVDRRSPLGLCLRRSLTRYFALRRIGVPVVVRFGARRGGPEGATAVAGHAWLTLDGAPYHEPDDEWRGFVVMYSHPKA